jgi:predicted nucleic acid-binding protein
MIFLDTSAVYALADRQDLHHRTAVERFTKLITSGEGLLTHNYVVLECFTLLQARLGVATALKFAKESIAFEVEWVDKGLHDAGMRELAASPKRRLSLVDHISFLVMKRWNLTSAFAFDPDFKTAGFRLYEPS